VENTPISLRFGLKLADESLAAIVAYRDTSQRTAMLAEAAHILAIAIIVAISWTTRCDLSYFRLISRNLVACGGGVWGGIDSGRRQEFLGQCLWRKVAGFISPSEGELDRASSQNVRRLGRPDV
jgi:hypothetical protein